MDRFEYLPNLKQSDVIFGDYDPTLSLPQGKYNVLKDGRWLAVIYQNTLFGKKLVLDVGTENNRKSIKQWINRYLQTKAYLLPENERHKLAPDKYNRNKMN